MSKAWSLAQSLLNTNGYSGWYLATITSDDEQTFLEAWLNKTQLNGEYWIGAYQVPPTQPTATAGWNWVTGEPWAYINWHIGEPNDAGGTANEQYAAVWGQSGWNWDWNDEGALGNIYGFIAEKGAPVPEPATMLLLGSGLLGLAGFGRRKMFKKV